eukprot:11187953-Lingulodinium_polyedra.AAC.1
MSRRLRQEGRKEVPEAEPAQRRQADRVEDVPVGQPSTTRAKGRPPNPPDRVDCSTDGAVTAPPTTTTAH